MRRDPFLHWVLTMVTFGQYGMFWGFRLACEANRLSGRDSLDAKKHARVFLIGYIIYIFAFVGISVTAGQTPGNSPLIDSVFWCAYVLALGLTCYFLWVLVRVAQMLRSIWGTDFPRSGTIVLLFFLWMTSLPLLQSHLNKLSTRHRSNVG